MPPQNLRFAPGIIPGGARIASILLLVLLFSRYAAGQTYYSQGNGNWETAANWNTDPGGAGAQPDSFPDDPIFNIVIQNGHTVTITGGGNYDVGNLDVQGALTSDQLSGTPRYLNVYGTDVVVDGTLGGANNGMSLDINGTSCLISGAGTVQLSRLKKDSDPGFSTITDLIIDINISLSWSLSAALLYQGIGTTKKSFNVTINEGRTVIVLSGDVSIDGIDGTNNSWADGTFIVNGTLDIGRDLWITTDNPATGDISYVIGPSGKIIVRRQVQGNSGAGPSIANLTIADGGLLQLTSAVSNVVFANTSTTLNSYDFATGSTVEYAGSVTQNIEDILPHSNMIVSGGGQKNLEGLTTVLGTLTLTNGIVQHGIHDLVIGPSGITSGGSTMSYCKTNSSGTLQQTVSTTPVFFPVGNSAYNPVTLTNNGTSDELYVRVTDNVLANGLSGAPFANFVVNRTWMINEANSGFANDLIATPQWVTGQELTGFTRANCYVSFHDGTSWNQDAAGPASGSNPFTRTRTSFPLNTSGETPVALASQGILPVELRYFDVFRLDKTAQLHWATASERNNAYFSMERSTDGLHYREIGQIKGAGNSDQQLDYTFTDENPAPGLNYFRLRQVDFDGAYAYSPVRTLRFDGDAPLFQVYPSPVTETLHIRALTAAQSDTRWQILDIAGRLLAEGLLAAGAEVADTPVGHLPRGIYLVRLVQGAQTQVVNFLKAE